MEVVIDSKFTDVEGLKESSSDITIKPNFILFTFASFWGPSHDGGKQESPGLDLFKYKIEHAKHENETAETGQKKTAPNQR